MDKSSSLFHPVIFLTKFPFVISDIINFRKASFFNFFLYLNKAFLFLNFKFFTKNSNFLYGLYNFGKTFVYFLFPIILSGFFILFYLNLKSIFLLKFLGTFFCIGMFFYWLISGFVFFIKKYQFSKFTSALQRFWKRSFIIFWVLEINLFLIYIYFMLNANYEPFYMYDNAEMFKTHLLSWRFFIIRLFILVILLVLSLYSLLKLKYLIFSKINIIFLAITICLLYVLWIEFYQFQHLLSYYGFVQWNFDYDENIWILENDLKRTRIVNHYVAITLILKFWHFFFIIIFWFFTILRTLELKRARYFLLSANLQNFVILYAMSWISMIPWFKWVFKFMYTQPYFWFYINTHYDLFYIFFNDLTIYSFSLLNCFQNYGLSSFGIYDFFYFNIESSLMNTNNFKEYIRDYFIQHIKN